MQVKTAVSSLTDHGKKTGVKGLSEKAVASGFALALLLLGSVGVESYLSVNRLIESQRWADHTHQVLDTLNQISRSIEEADRARRSYAVLKSDADLTTWRTGVQATQQAIAETYQLTSDNPEEQQRLKAIEPLIAERLALFQRSIDLVRRNKLTQTEQNDILKQSLLLQKKIQERLQVMERTEQALLQERTEAIARTVQQAVIAAGIGYGLSFCLLSSIFFLLQKEILSRKAAEIAVQKHAEDVYDLYNHAPCGYHSLDAAGTFIRINDTELEWLGYTRDEIIHKKTFGDLTTAQSALVFQENFPRFKEQGWLSDVEYEMVCKDGTILPVSLSATAIKDAAGNFVMSRSTLFDIRDRKQAQIALQQANEQLETRVQARTAELSQVNALLRSELIERKQAEQALSQSEKQLRLITDALPVLISYIDAEGRYRFNNRAYEQWFGYDWTTLRGRNLRDVLGENAYQAIKPHMDAVLLGQVVNYESAVPYKNGGQRWVSAVYIPDFGEKGVVKGYFALISDITDRKQAELALQQAKDGLEIQVQERTAALKQLNDDLRRSNQELEQFAYVASHDLQEPLRAIMGYTQLLTQDYSDRLDDTAQDYAAYIVDGAMRMQQLIQDLLHYSRAGTRDLVFEPTDCNAVLAQVLKNLQIAITESNATITYDSLPTVNADKSQLVQLLQNLIGNGIKFCRDGSPRIHISASKDSGQTAEGRRQEAEGAGEDSQNLELRSQDSGFDMSAQPNGVRSQGLDPLSPVWLFSVHDQGIGIKPRYLERIFEIFKRLHTRTEFPGTGIGLAICKKIVDRHGGQIWATSEFGHGTTFYFTIPSADTLDL